MIWDEETIRLLRELWAQGISTAEIGRRLRTSKNSVVGKAHRLGLDARQSPIRSIDRAKRAALETAIRRPAFTLPPLESANLPVEPVAPRQLDETDQRIAAMLRKGVSNDRVSKALGAPMRRVRTVRIVIDLPSRPKVRPKCPPSFPTAQSDRFDRTETMFDEPDFDEEDAAPLVEIAQKPLPVSIVPLRREAAPVSRDRTCEWLEGDTPRTFVRCTEPAVFGRSWCQDHCKRCFVRRGIAA